MIFHRFINLHILIYHTLIYSLSSNLKYYLNAINFLQLSVSAICSQFHWKKSKSNELQLKRLVYSCIMHDCKIFRVYEKNENWPTSNCLYKKNIEQHLRTLSLLVNSFFYSKHNKYCFVRKYFVFIAVTFLCLS